MSERKKIEGIGPRRAEIVVAGTAVFLRALESLEAFVDVLFGAPVYVTASSPISLPVVSAASAAGSARPQIVWLKACAESTTWMLKNAKHVARLATELVRWLANAAFAPARKRQALEAAAFLHNTGPFHQRRQATTSIRRTS